MEGYAFADASYQSTTQITGGTLVNALKSVSFLSKSMSNMFAPISTLTMVHGNQKATVSKESTEIIDLDKEEMIHIDNAKKTYTVVTFAQMRQAFQNMPRQIQQMQTQVKQEQAQQPQQPTNNLKTSYSVAVKNTGASKEVNGLMAQEQVITMMMTVTDPDAAATPSTPGSAPSGPNSMTYTVTTDAWIAPDPPEVKEMHDFDMRMGQKMMQGVDMQAWAASMTTANPGMAQILGSKPGATDAMAQMAKEMAKLKGTRVLEVTSMGGLAPAGTGQPSDATPATAAAPSNSSSSVPGQVATDTATQTAASEVNKLGTFGSALGSSALGAWHRKKASTPPPATAPAATPTEAPVNASGQAPQNVVLMSTTTQQMNFSAEAVPSSAFEVPKGFAQVPSAFDQMSK